jgi:GNAT superfamily N-acetyltransferase
MIENVVIEPMTEEFLLWRCLHGGPLSRPTIDQWPSDSEISWGRYRRRNMPLLLKLTRTYGACAIVARDGDQIVGQLRFYPKAVWDTPGAGGLCLQQDCPSGPADDFGEKEFPSLTQIEDKTLSVHCLMTGSPQAKDHPHRRKGLGTRMVRTLIQWAQTRGWHRIEAVAFEDLPIIYEITGSAGHTFWEKLGFAVAERRPHPELQQPSTFATTLEEQARAAGIPPQRARDLILMRLVLA